MNRRESTELSAPALTDEPLNNGYLTAERGIQLVSDEVYHPIYHGRQTKSAARLPHATVIADLSKAFSIAGVRTGWMIGPTPNA